MLTVNADIQIPLKELSFTFSRSSGPGGQNVNKLNTKATLRWPVAATTSLPDDVRARFLAKYHRRITSEGELVIHSQRFRDQGRNVADCLEKLRRFIQEVAATPVPRKRTAPTAAAKRKRLDEKRRRSQRKRLRQRHKLDDDT